MKTIFQQALDSLDSSTPFVVATVIRTWGSAPRKAGAHMFITAVHMSGSVSGGCVEGDVFTKAKHCISQGNGMLVHYGVSDADAWQVGLSCGGEIDVLLEVFSGNAEDRMYWNAIREGIETDSGAIVLHPLSGNAKDRKVILPGHVNDEEQSAKQAFLHRSHLVHEETGCFIEVVAPKHRLLVIGAPHLAIELVKLAHQFDFETTVIDPRGIFMNDPTLTGSKSNVINAWPAEVLAEFSLTPYTYAVTLSHDPKIDDQALEILLRSDVGYIGALGSKKSHAKRVERLEANGFTSVEIERIHAPVGIDIRAQSAQEIALSILADMIKEKNKYIS